MAANADALREATFAIPVGFEPASDPVLADAKHAWHAAQEAVEALLPAKRELLRHFDPPGMTRAAALCHCSRSGSLLLASYFDGHPDVVTLPLLCGEHIYRFHARYPQLSAWERLIVFPSFAAHTNPVEGDLFQMLGRADYYAGVQALYERYGTEEAAWLDSRRRFFQFLHAAFALGTGAVPATPRPLMLYAQHWVDADLAQRFVEDFPDAQFVHTIRDPITAIDSWFDRQTQLYLGEAGGRPEHAPYLNPAASAVLSFLAWDHPHRGLEARSRAVRFEDMHLAPDALMRRLAAWLKIADDPCLRQSTWLGKPYVVEVGGVPWCGPNPANAARRSRNLTAADRLVLFALLNENFRTWSYPSPRFLRPVWVRLALLAVLCWVPLGLEIKNARLVLERQARPALRERRFAYACGALLFPLRRRARIMAGLALDTLLRVTRRRLPLERL